LIDCDIEEEPFSTSAFPCKENGSTSSIQGEREIKIGYFSLSLSV
jgi:hypothetical protein